MSGPLRPSIQDAPRFTMPLPRRVDGRVATRVCALPGRALGAARIVVDAGALWEDPARAGVATLVADALAEGTKQRSADDFAEALESLGARVSSWGSWDAVGVMVGAPVEYLPDALGLLAEALIHPALPKDAIARLRTERLSHLQQIDAQPRGRARNAFTEAVFGTQAYGRDALGTPQTVSTIDEAAVASHHADWFSPLVATVVVAGDVEAIGDDAFTAPFEGWSAPTRERDLRPPVPTPGPTSTKLIHRPGAVQSAVALGHASVTRASDDHTPLSMVVDALGGLFDSRLNMELRERRGYTYGVGGLVDANRLAGALTFGGTIETKHTAASIEVFVAEIARMAADGPTQDEVERVRRHVDGSFPLRNQTATQIATLVSTQVVYGLADDYWNSLADLRARLDAASLAETAARLLDPDGLRIVIVGDADVIADDVRALGLGSLDVVEDEQALKNR